MRCTTPCCLRCTRLSTKNVFTTIFTSSWDLSGTTANRNDCNSRSMAVGGARPYLRSASVCPSAWRRSSRFCGDTMLSVILLTSVSNVFVQAAETDLVADLGWQKGFQSSPIDRNALRCSRAHRVFVSRVSSFLLPYLFRVSLRLFLHVVRFGTRRFDQPSKVGLASLDVT